MKPKQIEDYAAFNSRDAVVGIIIYDGFTLYSDIELANFNVCFTFVMNSTGLGYDILDVGIARDGDKKKVEPQGYQTFMTFDGFCVTIPKQEAQTYVTYLPLIRDSNFESAKRQLLTSTQVFL